MWRPPACCKLFMPAEVHKIRFCAVLAYFVGYLICQNVVLLSEYLFGEPSEGYKTISEPAYIPLQLVRFIFVPPMLVLLEAFARAIQKNYSSAFPQNSENNGEQTMALYDKTLTKVATKMVAQSAYVLAFVILWSMDVIAANYEESDSIISICELTDGATPGPGDIATWNVRSWDWLNCTHDEAVFATVEDKHNATMNQLQRQISYERFVARQFCKIL